MLETSFNVVQTIAKAMECALCCAWSQRFKFNRTSDKRLNSLFIAQKFAETSDPKDLLIYHRKWPINHARFNRRLSTP